MTTKLKKGDAGFIEKNETAQALALPAADVAAQNTLAANSVLDDVPEEVRKNLIGADDLVAEERLLAVLETGNPFSVDKIILALWHRFKHTEDRTKIITRLRALVKRGLVTKDGQSRSVYKLSPSADEQAALGALSQAG